VLAFQPLMPNTELPDEFEAYDGLPMNIKMMVQKPNLCQVTDALTKLVINSVPN
jgi:hypothetical protein